MRKELLIGIRGFIDNIQHINLNDAVSRPLTYQILTNNEHGFNSARNPIIWDDENERLYVFGINSYDFQQSQNYGNSKIPNPGMVTIITYEDIEQFKLVLSEPDFDAICDAIGGTLISDEQRKNIRTRLFVLTDPEYNIKQRQQTHY